MRMPVVEDVPAHDLGLQVVEGFADLFFGELGSPPSGNSAAVTLAFTRVDGRIALLLGGDLVGFAQLRFGDRGDRRLDLGLVGDDEFARLLRGLFGEADDRVDNRLEAAWPAMTAASMVSSESSLASDSTISTASPVPATTRSSVEVLHLLDGRIDLQFAVDIADARAADRAHEGNAGERQGGGGRDHRQDVGIVFKIVARAR